MTGNERLDDTERVADPLVARDIDVMHDHGVGSSQRRRRGFSERAPRTEVTVSERRPAVDGDDIQVPKERQMLETVIEQHEPQAGTVGEEFLELARGIGIAHHFDRRVAEFVLHHHRLIHGATSRLHDQRRDPVELKEVACDMHDNWGLAARRRQVAHADDRRRQRVLPKYPGPVKELPDRLLGRERGRGGTEAGGQKLLRDGQAAEVGILDCLNLLHFERQAFPQAYERHPNHAFVCMAYTHAASSETNRKNSLNELL